MANRGDNNAAQIAAQNAAKEHADYLVKLRTEFGQVDQSLTATNKLLQTGEHGRVLPSFVWLHISNSLLFFYQTSIIKFNYGRRRSSCCCW